VTPNDLPTVNRLYTVVVSVHSLGDSRPFRLVGLDIVPFGIWGFDIVPLLRLHMQYTVHHVHTGFAQSTDICKILYVLMCENVYVYILWLLSCYVCHVNME